MTEGNKRKSLLKRILCGSLSILLLPFHWLHVWLLWSEKQDESEKNENCYNRSDFNDDDIPSTGTSKITGHDLYDPNDLTNYSNPLSPFYQGYNSTDDLLKEMDDTFNPANVNSINNPDSLYNPDNTACSTDLYDPANTMNYVNPASPYYQGSDLNDTLNSSTTDIFHNDPFSDPFTNNFGSSSGSSFDEHF